jgi:hypothetical protein
MIYKINDKVVSKKEFVSGLKIDLLKDKSFLNSFDYQFKDPNTKIQDILKGYIDYLLNKYSFQDQEFIGDNVYSLI